MSEAVLWALSAEGVATLTLNRPEARNALNTGLAEALLGAARRAVAEAVKLVVIRAGGPVFCAGADLKERRGMTEDQVRAARLKGFAAYDAIERLPMPSIAVVEGAAIGSGVEIAAACDFVVATRRRASARRKRSGARSAPPSACPACWASGSPRT